MSHQRQRLCDVCLQIAPKEDELRAFKAYSGTFQDLSLPEQFLYVMASVPRLNDIVTPCGSQPGPQPRVRTCCCCNHAQMLLPLLSDILWA